MESRRRSSRIQNLQKQPTYSTPEISDSEAGRGVYKRRKAVAASKSSKPKQQKKLAGEGSMKVESVSDLEVKPLEVSNGAISENQALMVNGGSSSDGIEKPRFVRVTETIRLFNKHYLQCVQAEAIRVKMRAAEMEKGKAAGVKDDTKRGSKRPDLKAVSEMMKRKEILCPTKTLGPFQGVEVGRQFYSRAEMVVLGLHSHWINGIDYIGKGQQKEYPQFTLPIATSVVLSGEYEDDQDNYDEVVYTGQGGNDLLGNRKQIKDQEMTRGNLALKNSMEQKVPVRVVRGHECKSSYSGKIYTYDGMYKAVEFWAEKGISGFTIFKYRLKRVEGQAPLTSNQVHFSRGGVPKSISEIRGLVCKDISNGLERIPIPATNLVDDEPMPPPGFTYIKELIWPKDIKVPPTGPGCNCKGTCFDSKTCACATLNDNDFPYAERDGGRLIEPKAVVFECGPNCSCKGTCANRTSQKGLKFHLEVFRTPNKGWGVRSWDFIPSGSPICEYVGKLMKSDQIDPSADTNYVFDIDCLQTMNGLDGRQRRLRDVSLPDAVDKGDEPEFCIDGFAAGNVSRFINHSCQPNLFVQCVLSNHHDIKLARVVLMAADNIPPLQELSYDYGYALDSVMDADGKIKRLPCYCGAPECRKRLY